MKKLLLSLLLLSSAAQADQWLVNGKTYHGTMHKFNADRTMVWVTSDWDNYGGSWIKVSSLDPATRVRLKVATPQEQAAVLKAQAARIEEEKLAIERTKLNLLRLQEAQRMNDFHHRSALNQYPSQPYAPPAPQVVTSLSSIPQHRPVITPSVPYVPRVHSYQTSVSYVPYVSAQHSHTRHVYAQRIRTPYAYTPYTPYIPYFRTHHVHTHHVHTPYVRTPHVYIPHVHVLRPILIRIY